MAMQPRRGAGARGGERREEAHLRGRERRVFGPGPPTTARTGRMTHYFSVLSFKGFFFGFCLFFKKALRSATGYIYKM